LALLLQGLPLALVSFATLISPIQPCGLPSLGMLILFSSWDLNSKTKKQEENIVLSIPEEMVTDFKDCKIENFKDHANTAQSDIVTKTISCM
jgi:tRNA-binding EMAP/Myf-like protein